MIDVGLARQFTWLLASRLLGAAAQVIQFGVFARLAGPEVFGIGVAAVGVAMFASAATDLGLGAYVTRQRATDLESGLVGAAVRINFGCAVVLGVGGSLAFLLSSPWVGGQAIALVPLAWWAAAEKVTEVHLSIAVADGDTRENLMSVAVRRLGGLVLQGVLALSGIGPLLAFTSSQALACLVGAGWARHRLGHRVPAAGAGTTRDVLTASWPFYVNTLFTQLRNLDVTLVSIFASPTVAGLYGVPSRLTSPLRMLSTTMAQVTLPAAARAKKGDADQLMRAVGATLGGMTVLLAAVALASEPLVSLLGRDYRDAAGLLRVLCVGLIFASAVSFMNSLLQARGHAKLVGRVSAITTVLSLAAISVAASTSGAFGATFALSCSFVLQFVLLAPRSFNSIRQLA